MAETIVALVNELTEIVKERNALREEVAALKAGVSHQNRPKLQDREVGEIRRMFRTTGMTQREIADIFDVNQATVSRIISGQYHK